MPKVTSEDFRDDKIRIDGGQSGHLSFRNGYVNDSIHTDHGTVEVIISKGGSREYTILQTAKNGYRHIREWDRAFSKSFVKTLCKRFVKDLKKED